MGVRSRACIDPPKSCTPACDPAAGLPGSCMLHPSKPKTPGASQQTQSHHRAVLCCVGDQVTQPTHQHKHTPGCLAWSSCALSQPHPIDSPQPPHIAGLKKAGATHTPFVWLADPS